MTVYKWYIVLVILLLWMGGNLRAQPLLPCSERPTQLLLPQVNDLSWCLENVPLGAASPPDAFSALAVAPDATLYATQPFRGEVWALQDGDGDGLPETPAVLIDGLRLPNALAQHNDSLYIAGDGIVYRWADELTVLRDDLPGGRGHLPHALIVHDERLWVGVPAPCEQCLPDDPLHGTVISMALDGSDLQIEARGLHYPAALMADEGGIWVTDTAPTSVMGDNLDEVNWIADEGEDVLHFGWPHCIGNNQATALEANFDCEEAVAPRYNLPTGSRPLDMRRYTATTFPELQASVLLAFGGASDSAVIRGHTLVSLTGLGSPTPQMRALLPYNQAEFGRGVADYDANDGFTSAAWSNIQALNRGGRGIWPRHIYALAIDANGWLYVSVSGGALLVLRPQA